MGCREKVKKDNVKDVISRSTLQCTLFEIYTLHLCSTQSMSIFEGILSLKFYLLSLWRFSSLPSRYFVSQLSFCLILFNFWFVTVCIYILDCYIIFFLVQFSPAGHYFASCSHDRTARIWSMDRIKPLRIMAGHLSDVDVSFSSYFFSSIVLVLIFFRFYIIH